MFILTHVLLKLAVLHLFGVLKSLCGKIIIVAYYKKVKHFKGRLGNFREASNSKLESI